MAHDELTHTRKVYTENIEDVHFKYTDADTLSGVTPGLTALNDFVGNESAIIIDLPAPLSELNYLHGALENHYLTNGQDFDQAINSIADWDAFVSMLDTESSGNIPPPTTEQIFLQGYRRMLLTDEDVFLPDSIDVNALPTSGDWGILIDPMDSSLIDEPQDFEDQFVAAFNHFISEFPPISDLKTLSALPPTAPYYFPDIFGRHLYNFMQPAVTIRKDTIPLVESMTPAMLTTSFEDIYESIFNADTSVDDTQFVAFVQEFYKSKVNEKGFFIPTQDVDDWVTFLARKATKEIAETSLASIGAEKVLILDRILRLVSIMIEVLQKVAAVQAERLTFLTNYQKAYTEALEELPVFIAEGGIAAIDDPENKEEIQAREDLNNANATFKETLTARRQILSDDAKSLQSNINQSNDAVAQQANIATAILQQLSTILGAIFR